MTLTEVSSPPASDAPWPAEVEFILSALEAGTHRGATRRAAPRRAFRTIALLRLYSDGPSAAPWTLYTRDACARSIGFITRHRLPLGYGGVVTLRDCDGAERTIEGTLSRCRETVGGWYEGAMNFNRTQDAMGSR